MDCLYIRDGHINLRVHHLDIAKKNKVVLETLSRLKIRSLYNTTSNLLRQHVIKYHR